MSATCLATGPGRVTWHCKARQGLGGFRRPRSRLGSVNMFELAMMASARHNGWSYLPYFPPSATPNHRSGGATDPGMGEFMHRTGRTAIARGPYPSATKDRDRNWQVLVGTDRPARRHSTAYSCLCMQKKRVVHTGNGCMRHRSRRRMPEPCCSALREGKGVPLRYMARHANARRTRAPQALRPGPSVAPPMARVGRPVGAPRIAAPPITSPKARRCCVCSRSLSVASP